MDTMTATPVAGSQTSTSSAHFSARSDRRSQAQAIRSTLEEAAAGINAFHAQVLGAVIAMKESGLHRSAFGFSALRSLLLSQFDFTLDTAGSIAVIAKLSAKFTVLAEAATTGMARIDQVAYRGPVVGQDPGHAPVRQDALPESSPLALRHRDAVCDS